MLRGNRFRLVTLGRLTLIGADGEEDVALAKRRRKLAVLAVLAMARRPMSRDALVEMFWGEQDESRARHSLSNALSSLRRTLGEGSITTRETEVALAPDAPLDIDAIEFSEAIEAQDRVRALKLYGGAFLAGAHVENSTSFEHWVSRERRRLEALFVKACAQQCETLARGRKWNECVTLAGRWLETDPLSVDAALFLLNGVKAPGTRSALADALDEYERLRARLAREFELTPVRAVAELAGRIREELAAVTSEHPTMAVASVPAVAREPEPVAVASEQPPNAVDSGGAPSGRVRRPLARRLLFGAAAAAGILVVVMQSRQAGSRGAVRGAGKPVVAVLSMDVRTNDSTLAWLAEGLPEMIDGKLARVGAIDVVAPAQVRALLDRSGNAAGALLSEAKARDLARRVGATLAATGAIGRDGGNLVLELSVHDVVAGNLVHNAVLSHADALALADEAAARIVSTANVGGAGSQLAELETSSLAAYQHYMRALQAGQAGLLSESKRELDAAIAADSGFITGIRARISIAISESDIALLDRLRALLRRHANRATEFDRLHQDAWDAFIAGEHERSEALARALVRRYPRDPRSYQLLQDILGSHGKFADAEPVALQALKLDSLAMEAGSGPCAQCAGFFNIVNLHWVKSDLDGAALWARRWIRQQPDAASAWAALAWTYSYMQLPDSALPLMQRAVSLSGGDNWASDQYARMLLVARRYAAADSAIAALEARTRPGESQTAADLRSLYEREHGRVRASTRVISQLDQGMPNANGFAELIRADNLRLLGDYRASARRYDRMVHTPGEAALTLPRPSHTARAFCWHHALVGDALGATGDTIALRALADTLEGGCGTSFYGRDWRLFHHVRGLLAMRRGAYAEAERELAQAVWAPIEGWSRTVVELARAQAADGRPRDAIATLRRGYATRLDAMGRYAPISELDFWMARAFAQAGESDSARVYAERVRSAWRDADPEVRRLLRELP